MDRSWSIKTLFWYKQFGPSLIYVFSWMQCKWVLPFPALTHWSMKYIVAISKCNLESCFTKWLYIYLIFLSTKKPWCLVCIWTEYTYAFMIFYEANHKILRGVKTREFSGALLKVVYAQTAGYHPVGIISPHAPALRLPTYHLHKIIHQVRNGSMEAGTILKYKLSNQINSYRCRIQSIKTTSTEDVNTRVLVKIKNIYKGKTEKWSDVSRHI